MKPQDYDQVDIWISEEELQFVSKTFNTIKTCKSGYSRVSPTYFQNTFYFSISGF